MKNIIKTLVFLCFSQVISLVHANDVNVSKAVQENKQIITYASYDKNLKGLALKHDLILLDLDDVVITPKQYLCGSAWHHMYATANKHRLKPSQLVDVFYNCPTKFEAVSEKLVSDFSDISDQKKVFGLTSRIIDRSLALIDKIKMLGMKFSSTDTINHPLIKDGIIFVGFNTATARPYDKGVLLQELIAKGFFGEVKSVMFIDDALKNLQNVRDALSKDITFTGIHFTAVKTKLHHDFVEGELEKLAEYQNNTYVNYNYMPSNQEYMMHLHHDL